MSTRVHRIRDAMNLPRQGQCRPSSDCRPVEPGLQLARPRSCRRPPEAESHRATKQRPLEGGYKPHNRDKAGFSRRCFV